MSTAYYIENFGFAINYTKLEWMKNILYTLYNIQSNNRERKKIYTNTATKVVFIK